MRILVALAALALSGCASMGGPARLAMGVEVSCDLPAEEVRDLRGRTNAMERLEKAELSRSLALVDAAAILGGNVRAIRQGLIDRSNANLRRRRAPPLPPRASEGTPPWSSIRTTPRCGLPPASPSAC